MRWTSWRARALCMAVMLYWPLPCGFRDAAGRGRMTTMMQRVFVSGKVQRIGYRDWVVRKAGELGVVGWVRNLKDGRVELLIAGEEGATTALIDACHEGPPQCARRPGRGARGQRSPPQRFHQALYRLAAIIALVRDEPSTHDRHRLRDAPGAFCPNLTGKREFHLPFIGARIRPSTRPKNVIASASYRPTASAGPPHRPGVGAYRLRSSRNCPRTIRRGCHPRMPGYAWRGDRGRSGRG